MRLPPIIAVFVVTTLTTVGLSEETRELRPFTPEGARCVFSTVGGRKPVATTYQRDEGNAVVKGHVFCFDQRTCRCQVRYVDLPSGTLTLSPRELIARYGLKTWTAPGQLEKIGTVKAADIPGEEYLATWPHSQTKEPLKARVRVFIVAKRAYFVSAGFSGAKQSAAESEALAFLESFRIVPE